MPWKEQRAMSQKMEFVERAMKPGARVSTLCREYGISRETGYKWLRRFKRDGAEGLEEQSRRPSWSCASGTHDEARRSWSCSFEAGLVQLHLASPQSRGC